MWISASHNTKNTHQKIIQNGIQKRRTTNIRKLLLMLFLWKPKAPKAPKCSLLFCWFSHQEQCCKRFTERERERHTHTHTPDQRLTQGLASPLDSKPKSSTPAAAACRSAKKKTPQTLCTLWWEKRKHPTRSKRPMQLDNHNQACMHSSLSTREKQTMRESSGYRLHGVMGFPKYL